MLCIGYESNQNEASKLLLYSVWYFRKALCTYYQLDILIGPCFGTLRILPYTNAAYPLTSDSLTPTTQNYAF